MDFQDIHSEPDLEDASAGPSDSGILDTLKDILQIILIASVLFLLVNLLSARVRVESISMEPNLYEGDFVVVNRMAYRWSPPQRGDVIVFRFPGASGTRYIKRIVGVGGDHLVVEDKKVYVNDVLLDEPYIAAPPVYAGEWRVPQNQVFVLGDNRNNSNDSKNWGMLDVDAIIGKAVLVYWPPNHMRLIPHYELVADGGE